MYFFFVQPNEIKYNSYLYAKHPDWQYLNVISEISSDPLKLRIYINELLAFSFISYFIASFFTFKKKINSLNQTIFSTDNKQLLILRNTSIHFIIIVLIFIFTKSHFINDLGDYWIAFYISIMIYATTYQVLNKSVFFQEEQVFFNIPLPKYSKSSLSEKQKETILSKIKAEMEENNYFTNNLASLSDLSKRITETKHHVSQVIKEKMRFRNILK